MGCVGRIKCQDAQKQSKVVGECWGQSCTISSESLWCAGIFQVKVFLRGFRYSSIFQKQTERQSTNEFFSIRKSPVSQEPDYCSRGTWKKRNAPLSASFEPLQFFIGWRWRLTQRERWSGSLCCDQRPSMGAGHLGWLPIHWFFSGFMDIRHSKCLQYSHTKPSFVLPNWVP